MHMILSSQSRRTLFGATAAVALLASGLAADAQSLKNVLATAYANNPTLRAERARLRATDEGVSQALSGWRPTVTTSGDYGILNSRVLGKIGGTVRDKRKPYGVNVTISQSIFSGFKTINGTNEAESNVLAGREDLINVEQQILLGAATAFFDVVRDQTILRLRRKNVRVLREQLRASQARFDVGEITRTDVAQARARKAGADSNVAQAVATLAASRSQFQQIVGQSPGSLKRPRSTMRLLPKTLNEGYAVAKARSPVLLAAKHREDAAKFAIAGAKGDLLPEVTIEAEYNRRYRPSLSVTRTKDTRVTGRLTVPLYQGGAVHSRVRQAHQIASQRRMQVLEAWRQVKAGIVSAWESMRAARLRISAAQSQVDANSLAFRGVVQEAKVGSRTTLDILDAEQELNDSRVSLANAQRDAFVAIYQVLSSVGQLTSRDLRLNVPLYNPATHYDRVRGKLFGIGAGNAD